MNSSDDDEEYIIEKVVDERGTGNKKEYLVKFKDYGDEDNTWTSKEDISPELIHEYKKKSLQKEGGDDDDDEFVIEKNCRRARHWQEKGILGQIQGLWG